jgi:hypothetical protein
MLKKPNGLKELDENESILSPTKKRDGDRGVEVVMSPTKRKRQTLGHTRSTSAVPSGQSVQDRSSNPLPQNSWKNQGHSAGQRQAMDGLDPHGIESFLDDSSIHNLHDFSKEKNGATRSSRRQSRSC